VNGKPVFASVVHQARWHRLSVCASV